MARFLSDNPLLMPCLALPTRFVSLGDYDNVLALQYIFGRGYDEDPSKSTDPRHFIKFKNQAQADEVLSTPGESMRR